MALSLGYLGFEVKDPEAWQAFGTKVLGLGMGRPHGEGEFSLRMDDYAQRLFIEPGSDDLSVMGWEAPDTAALEALVSKLRDAGVEVGEANTDLREKRGVERLFQLADPSGNRLELFVGPKKADPFRSKLVPSGFVTGVQGMGHLVIGVDDHQQALEFYTGLMGFRLSDRITCEVYGYPVDIAFLHHSPRHHSLAFGERQKKRIHHFMLEVGSFDDVGLCYDRALANRVRIMQTLGRHPNDRMFSFYGRTPSGFQFEFGWGGRQVDDEKWHTTTYDHISEWGHHPPQVITGEMPPARGGDE